MAKQHDSRHHRKPRSLKGSNTPENISIVPIKQHRLWHELFFNMTAEEIFNQINHVWLDPEYTIILQRNYNHQ